jgi:hypothetical protein
MSNTHNPTTTGADKRTSPRWWTDREDEQAHIEDSIRSGEMDIDLVGVSVVELFNITDAEATADDIEWLNLMSESAHVLDEWRYLPR